MDLSDVRRLQRAVLSAARYEDTADRAREIAPRCTGQSAAEDPQALSPSLIEAVEPAYSTVQSGNDRAVHLRGARLHVRPQPNLSSQSLQRSLECHQARVALGGAQALANDPYVLPGAWLDIDVDSIGDGFVVAVRVDKFDDAHRILDRARHFAASQP